MLVQVVHCLNVLPLLPVSLRDSLPTLSNPLTQLIMVIVSTILHVTFVRSKENQFWYLPKSTDLILPTEISYLLTMLVLFNNMIPISLYITLEIANFVQAMFINKDKEMYEPSTDTASNCKALNLCQEIGQVQYILSDKTGTLTQNLMKFKCCSVDSTIYGVPDEGVEWTGSDMAAASRDSPNDEFLDGFLMVLSLCHTVEVKQREGDDLEYEADNPDEKALVGWNG